MTATGAFVGNDPSSLDAFTKWMGKAPDNLLVALNQTSWDAFDSSVPYFTGLWQDSPSTPMYGVPLVTSGSSLEQAASGTFNDHYKKAAETLAASNTSGDPMYIRVGWEFNGDWQPWSAKGHEKAFVEAYHQLVDTFRSVSSNFKFVWDVNANTTNMKAEDAYPGDKYVDVVGMDVYYNPSWDPADPETAFQKKVNDPYGLQWQQDFAKQHGKDTAISEWGVETDNSGPYIKDMAAWLTDHKMLYENYWDTNADFAGTLHENQYPTAGAVFKDVIGDLDDGATTPSTGTPSTGTPTTGTPTTGTPGTGTPTTGTPTTGTPTTGTPATGTPTTGGSGTGTTDPATPPASGTDGADTLVLKVSADSYKGDPHFVVTVDGRVVGGTQSASAQHSAGATQDVVLKGDFGSGAHDVGVQFVDDLWAGSSDTDRNLYLHQVSLNGQSVAGGSPTTEAGYVQTGNGVAALLSNATVGFHLPAAGTSGSTPDTPSTPSTPATPTTPATGSPVTGSPVTGGDTESGSDGSSGGTALTLKVAGDSFEGDPQFTVKVDGKQVGGIQTAHADHGTGQFESLVLRGDFSASPQSVAIEFVNDKWGGTPDTDRNLYVGGVSVGDKAYGTWWGSQNADLLGNDSVDFRPLG